MSGISLYELVGDYRELEDGVDGFIEAIEAGEMDEAALWDTLDGLKGAIEDKCDAIVQIIRNKELLAASIDVEIKRLTARKKAVLGATERLKDYVGESLSIAGIDKMETQHARLSFRSSETCDIRDPGMVVAWALVNGRADLIKIKDPEPSTSAIKDAIKAGEKIPGAVIVKNRNLQIK